MALAGGDNTRNLAAIALLALFLSFSSFSFVNLVTRPVACFPGDIGSAKCPQTVFSLGTWNSFPTSAQCSPLPTGFAGVCELLGNETYRRLSSPGASLGGTRASLMVGCSVFSNTVGAQLQLQYALYSTGNQSNSTNWQSIGQPIFIDGTTVTTCGNNSGASTYSGIVVAAGTLLNASSDYEFRAVGTAGGGAGDNPRFTYIGVQLSLSQERIWTPVVSIHSVTATTTFIYTNIAPTASTTINFGIVSSNVTTSTQCGTGDRCVQAGTSSCAIASGANSCSGTWTYPTAFTGTVESVVTPLTPAQAITILMGQYTMLQTETITV